MERQIKGWWTFHVQAGAHFPRNQRRRVLVVVCVNCACLLWIVSWSVAGSRSTQRPLDWILLQFWNKHLNIWLVVAAAVWVEDGFGGRCYTCDWNNGCVILLNCCLCADCALVHCWSCADRMPFANLLCLSWSWIVGRKALRVWSECGYAPSVYIGGWVEADVKGTKKDRDGTKVTKIILVWMFVQRSSQPLVTQDENYVVK